MNQIEELKKALKIIEDVNEVGLGKKRQDVILKSIENELSMVVFANDLAAKYKK